MPNRLSRFADGIMEACWLLALIVTPLFFNIYSSRVFEPDKISLLRSLALVTLAAWLIKLISQGGPRFEASRSQYATLAGLYRAPLVAPLLALILVYLIATIFSVAPHASLFGSYQRLQGTFTTFSYLVLFAAIGANLRRRSQAERILTTIIVSSLPVALYGVLQHFQLDPLPWGGDTSTRVTGHMGNAIFIAAYLIMSSMVTLGRVVTSFHTILTDEDDRHMPANIIRAALYIFILAVSLVTIWWSGSRGPWLGLLAGLFFFFVLLSLQWRARTLTLVTMGLAALAAAFLIVFNIPNGPLQSLRAVPGVGRLGEVFETEGGSGRVRVLIWGGVIQLMTPHPPLEFPDGSVDRWNAIRPLIGYGPEALYVAFNRFYPPELGQLEARNASPDRAHNETFDALAFTGLLGLAAYLALFTAVFYYALKWLGVLGSTEPITSARRRTVFMALVLGGGLATAVGFMVWQGPEYFGVGLPLGMLLGLIIFLTLYALAALPRTQAAAAATPAGEAPPAGGLPETWRAVALISAFAAIVAHFTEIHFGIAIVSTRTHFWVLTGLMLVLGLIGASLTAPTENGADSAALKNRRRGRAPTVRIASTPEGGSNREEWAPVLIGGVLTAAILVTLGFNFITNTRQAQDVLAVLSDAFTLLPRPDGPQRSFAVLGLVLLSWVAGGTLSILEEVPGGRGLKRASLWASGLAVALAVGVVAWLVMAQHLASRAGFVPQTLEELQQTAGHIAGTVTLYYTLMALVMLGLALALNLEWPVPGSGRTGVRVRGLANTSPVAVVSYVTLPLAAVIMSVLLNLQIVQADIVYKTGLQFDDSGQPQVAIELYKRALSLAPGEDYYYLFLGRSYLNATAQETDPGRREALLATAEEQLKLARELNPLNTDHTANLARLNRRWAEMAAEAGPRAQRAQTSNDYYVAAVKLSPNNAGLWNEWAALDFQVRGDMVSAQQHLDHSFSIDEKFEQTYQLQADLYLTQAQQQSADAEAQKALYDQAIQAYLTAIQAGEARGSNVSGSRINLATAYAQSGQTQPAIDLYQQLLADPNSGIEPWRLNLAISELQAQLGDMGQARASAETALQLAPEADKAGVQTWLDRLP